MATIALYANQMNQMPGLIRDIKKAVADYKSELSFLKAKALTIDKNVCNLENVISSIQSSSQTQEAKIASLDTFCQNSETFIAEAVRIDDKVASLVRQRKDEFYSKYAYLTPVFEKSPWENICDGFASFGEWCKEHWKLIATAAIVLLALACLLVPGLNALVAGLVIGKLLFAMAIGALIGAGIGGIVGGIVSAATGGSFFEGFENGAFSGAVAGLISGGMGFALSSSGTVALTLGRTLLTGGVSASGSSLLSDLGNIVFRGDSMTLEEVLGNMLVSGVFGAAFAGLGYGISKSLSALFNRNSSWFSNVKKEFLKIGETAKPNYGRVTAYHLTRNNGFGLTFANRAGRTIFRVEFDPLAYLHLHAPPLFTTEPHVPLSPIIDSALSRNAMENSPF